MSWDGLPARRRARFRVGAYLREEQSSREFTQLFSRAWIAIASHRPRRRRWRWLRLRVAPAGCSGRKSSPIRVAGEFTQPDAEPVQKRGVICRQRRCRKSRPPAAPCVARSRWLCAPTEAADESASFHAPSFSSSAASRRGGSRNEASCRCSAGKEGLLRTAQQRRCLECHSRWHLRFPELVHSGKPPAAAAPHACVADSGAREPSAEQASGLSATAADRQCVRALAVLIVLVVIALRRH